MASVGGLRAKHLLTGLLFLVSGIALFYTSLAYALSDLWHSGRSESDVDAGHSAAILIVSIVIAMVGGASQRASGRGSRTANIVLIIGLLAACLPWIA